MRSNSQVSSLVRITDEERERLVVIQLVIILWNHLILRKKVITTTNNNQCKPIKKEKIRLLKKLFVNKDNKNKVNDEKKEIKTYLFHKWLLILKQWLMRKN